MRHSCIKFFLGWCNDHTLTSTPLEGDFERLTLHGISSCAGNIVDTNCDSAYLHEVNEQWVSAEFLAVKQLCAAPIKTACIL